MPLVCKAMTATTIVTKPRMIVLMLASAMGGGLAGSNLNVETADIDVECLSQIEGALLTLGAPNEPTPTPTPTQNVGATTYR